MIVVKYILTDKLYKNNIGIERYANLAPVFVKTSFFSIKRNPDWVILMLIVNENEKVKDYFYLPKRDLFFLFGESHNKMLEADKYVLWVLLCVVQT